MVSIFYPTIHTPTNALLSAKYMTMQPRNSIGQSSVLLGKGHAAQSLSDGLLLQGQALTVAVRLSCV